MREVKVAFLPLRVAPAELTQIDAARSVRALTRSAWVRRAIAAQLRREARSKFADDLRAVRANIFPACGNRKDASGSVVGDRAARVRGDGGNPQRAGKPSSHP